MNRNALGPVIFAKAGLRYDVRLLEILPDSRIAEPYFFQILVFNRTMPTCFGEFNAIA